MPIYQYKCPGCHKIEELTRKVNDNTIPECIDCYYENKPYRMNKCVTSSSIHFKGSGFYENDYKGK